MATMEFSTPSPPRVRTPRAPRYGFSDSPEPHSPRKSARISKQANNRARTPEPQSSSRKSLNTSFSTPSVSPKKTRAPTMDSVRRASGVLTTDGISTAAQKLGIDSKQPHKPATASRNTMLPTPAKTPRKQPDQKTEAATREIARNLFPSESDAAVESVLASQKKQKKKYSGITLDSFRAEPIDEPIAIFTDSRDRVPELDNREDNPFYGDAPTTSEATKRRVPRTKTVTVTIPGEGEVPLEDAIQREDGMIYVFRGKKLWKPRKAATSADVFEDEETPDIDVGSPRRVTRSSSRRTLLFPSQDKGKTLGHNSEDEEATTDIEDHVVAATTETVTTTSKSTPGKKSAPGTPTAPRYAPGPTSPPATGRATRTVKSPESPSKKAGKARSPFDGWRRSKSSTRPHGQKREGDALPEADQGSKRARV